MKPNNDIYMYLLMRNDIPSLNPGKLAAQASHVANACVKRIRKAKNFKKLNKMLDQWEKQTDQGFGTAICLAVQEYQLDEWSNWHNSNEHIFGIVTDPSYPCYIPAEVAEYLQNNDAGQGKSAPNLKDDGFEVYFNPEKPSGVFLRPEDVGAFLFGNKNDPNIQRITKELKLYP